jgi:hypothetical protein
MKLGKEFWVIRFKDEYDETIYVVDKKPTKCRNGSIDWGDCQNFIILPLTDFPDLQPNVIVPIELYAI